MPQELSELDEARVLTELAVYLRSRTVADSSTFACPTLRGFVASRFRLTDDSEIDDFTASMICVAAQRADHPETAAPGPVRLPLMAAKHLLGLGQYPSDLFEIVADTGWTLSRLMESTTSESDPVRQLSLRTRIAVIAGKYGTDRHLLSEDRPTGKKNLAEVSFALLSEIRALEPNSSTKSKVASMTERRHAAATALAEKASAESTAKARKRVVPFDLDELPPVLVGREKILSELRAAKRSRTYLFAGDPGVGKTSLALKLARTWAAEYPDGAVQLDVRAYSNKATLTSADAFRSILGRFGFDQGELSTETPQLRSVYRSFLAKRRVLIFADNVADAETVRDLAPGAMSVLIVTSRRGMPSLKQRMKIEEFEVTRLDEPQSLELFVQSLSRARVLAELESAKKLAFVCDYLPMALTLVAVKLAGNGHSLTSASEQLATARDGVLAEQLPDTDLTMTAVFDWSLDLLAVNQQTLLIALANLPLRFTNLGTIQVLGFERYDIERLVNEHLVVEIQGQQTFVFHDLTRDYLQMSRTVRRATGLDALQPAVNPLVRSVREAANKASTEIRERRRAREVSELSGMLQLIPPKMSYPEAEQWFADAVNLMEIGRWAFGQAAYAFAVQCSRDSVILLLQLGSFAMATSVLADLFAFLEGWERSLVHSKGRAASYKKEIALERRMAIAQFLDVNMSVLVYTARTGWTSRTDPILRNLEALSEEIGLALNESVMDIWKKLYVADNWQMLLTIVRGSGETMNMHPEVDDHPVDKFERAQIQLAALEQMANLEGGGDLDQAIITLNHIYELSVLYAEAVPSIDLLWSVEPPLIRYAHLLLEHGDQRKAVEVLRWVERLYASRFSFYGHWFAVRDWADLIEAQST